MGDTAEGLASAPQSQDGSRDPAAEREIAEDYGFAPIYPPLETIRETLYDSAALQDEIDRFLEANWQGYKKNQHGTFAIGVELLHRRFRKVVERVVETALENAGYSLHDVQIALRRARLSNPTGDDSGVVSMLAAAFEFDTFAELLREKYEEKKRAIAHEKRQRLEKYQAAGGRRTSQKHLLPEHIEHE